MRWRARIRRRLDQSLKQKRTERPEYKRPRALGAHLGRTCLRIARLRSVSFVICAEIMGLLYLQSG